ncbi:hypothetical protein BDV10DRAFT_189394 [Aspergillus recurvatus]
MPCRHTSVIEAAKSRLVFWVIDSLDDLLADEKRAGETPWLLPFLGSMMHEASTAKVPLHICYTKRDHPTIMDSLLAKGGHYCYFEVRMDDHNRPDIERFLESTTRFLSGELGPHEMSRLMKGIMDRVGSGFAAAAAYAEELKKQRQFTDQIDMLPSPPAVADMWHCVLYQLDLGQLALIGFAMTAQRLLVPHEFSCVSGFTHVDDLSEYNSMLIESTMGLLRLELMSGGHTPCVVLTQKSLATYFDSQPGHRLMEGFVHVKGHRLGLLPGYEGPALVLDGDDTQKVEFPKELVDLTQSPMLEYTVEHLMTHAASINNMNELSELSRALDHRSVDGKAADLLPMWCHLHNSSCGTRIYGPGVTIWHILAQYNVSDYLAQLLKEDWNAAAETDNGQTLLHWAAHYNSKDSMEVILGTNFGDFEEKQKRALEEAAPTFLIEYPLYMVNYQETQHGRTALQLAATKGHVELVALLLTYERSLRAKLSEALGDRRTDLQETKTALGNIHSGINSISTGGFTALHYGACSKQPEIVAALLENGAAWRLENKEGEAALQIAIRMAEQEVSLDVETKEVVRILKAASFADIGLARALKSGTGAVDAQFHAHKVEFNGAWPSVSRLSIKQLLSVRCSIIGDGPKCTWIHLPANNVEMSWAEVLITIKWLIELNNNLPHQMPYIHWETQEKQMTLEYFSLCKFIAELEPGMVLGFLSQLATEQPTRALLLNKKGAPTLQRLSDVIVSCFPQRRECGLDDPDRFDTTDVFENILTSLAANPLNTAEDNAPMELMLRIVRECSSTCFDPMKNLDDDFQFLDVFNNSINRVADEEMNCYEHFVDTLRATGHHDQLSTHREFHLLRQIKDIIEELRMLLQAFTSSRMSYHPWPRNYPYPLRLMEVRQRHATLSEAQATGRQVNTIMVFTVVTILFLLASFIASFLPSQWHSSPAYPVMRITWSLHISYDGCWSSPSL